jgi:intracellular sulfur oxidation DsrE/DsrF family protein
VINGPYNRRAVIGGSLLAAGMVTVPRPAAALGPAGSAPWRAAMEPQDAWLDKPGTRHRLVLDTATAEEAQRAVSYVEGFYSANKSGYGLGPESLGVVIVLRHLSTPFGYNDRIWSKYGPVLADKLKLSGQNAIRAAHANPLLSAPTAENATPGSGGEDDTPTLASLAAKGVHFAVCEAATTQIAKLLLKEGDTAAAIEAELRANLVPGSVLTASGLVAVNRAQEHGYAFVSIVE